MSGETPETPETTEVVESARTGFVQRYAGGSGLFAEGDGARLALQADLDRDPVQARGRIQDPLQFRAALTALYAIVQSDFSYKPKDRTAYMAYQRMKQKAASLSQWEAQKAYHAWLQRNDPNAFLVLDPVVSVQPDVLALEVFSKDEGTYAQLTVDWSAFDLEGPLTHGTTHIDFSQALDDGLQRLRSYRATRFSVGREAVSVATEGQPEVMEKQIQVPDAWLRGFLQVQSASTLPMASFSLAPMDLYNLLRHLRLHGDKKTGGRAVRVELVPGESPRLVLEPWEEVLQTAGAVYAGRTAQVVRIWGRRRLMLIRRFLPFVQSIEVQLLGSGLPSFWIMKAGPYTLTVGMTGFTAANWSKSLSFDVLLPRPEAGDQARDAVLGWLRGQWKGSIAEVAKGAAVQPAAARKALQGLCQEGLVMFDLAHDRYRLRPLTATPLDPARLAYRNLREREAHDLLAVKDAVKIVKENRIFGQGLELEGKVAVAAEKREYRPVMLVDDEARVTRAECTCRFFRTQGMKHGPCTHLTALAILHARLEAKRSESRGKGRATVVVETRSWSRRHPRGESVCQVSLDHTHVRIRWGERSDTRLRLQHLVFSSQAEARAAYFARIDDLEAKGFLDATAG